MENQSTSGAPWVSAVGTILSAVGSTPFKKIDKEILSALNLWGNVLQAAGNALQADQDPEISLAKLGNQLQATGNVTVVSGMVMEFEKETKEKLIITGNWFQATGGLMVVASDIENNPPWNGSKPDIALDIIGNLLQAIGNSLQAIGDTEELKGNEEIGETTDVLGSWIQAIGSVLSALAVTPKKHESMIDNEKT